MTDNADIALPEDLRDVPPTRPGIEITPLDAEPFAVAMKELLWWYVVPEVGDETLWLTYEEPGWTLSGHVQLQATSKAVVHGVQGVRISIREWQRPGLQEPWRGPIEKIVYGRLTEDTVEWLGVEESFDGVWDVATFMDEGFDKDFGKTPRRIQDTGRIRQTGEDSFVIDNTDEELDGAVGCGMFTVRVGDREFQCLRVLEFGECWQSGARRALEAYVTSQGRTVLTRHYRAPDWASGTEWIKPWTGGRPFDKAFPDHRRITVNGQMLVHWNDDITSVSLGLS
jgi:hypothetical protein